MSSSHIPFPIDDETLEGMAASWLAQREEGFTPEQEAEFVRWRLADPRHGAAVARLEETCELLGQLPLLRGNPRLQDDKALAPSAGATAGNRGSVLRHPSFRRMALAAAAVAAAFAIAGTVWMKARPGGIAQTYSTSAKGYQRLQLPDRSVAQLNGDTEMRVNFSAAERNVNLAQGEAYFHVAKDAARPFVVQAQNVRVVAVGTAFNVKVAGDRVEVLVTEGVVRLERDGVVAHEPLLLGSGEHALVAQDAAAPGVPVQRYAPAQVRTALAWQDSPLVFVEAPLAEVIGRFNERNRVQIELGDASLGSRVVGGTFRQDDVETFVRLLETSGDIVVERRHDRVVLRRAR